MKHEVHSTSIKSIEETGRGSMIVEFRNRGKYEFFDVPLETINEFVNASSVGRYFNEFIRGKYREEPRT
jgi:hypothetical protein